MEKKHHRIVTSSDENPMYIGFWPSVARMWKKYNCTPCLAFITDKDENHELVQELKKHGEVHLFKPYNDTTVPLGNQAKVARTYLASLYTDDYCTLADIDLYLMNAHWLQEKLNHNFNYNFLMCIGQNGYSKTPDEGKFPMYYTSGLGQFFASFANPTNLSFQEWIKSFIGIQVFDKKEDISLPLYTFSDESLYRVLLGRWKQNWRIKHMPREDCFINEQCNFNIRRIDRGNWNAMNKKWLEDDIYIDCFPLRPLQDNYEHLKPILKKLEIYDENDESYFKKLKQWV